MSGREKRVSFGPAAGSAAGLAAVVEAVRHAVGKAGAARGVSALTQVNKAGGFDCPGCAWPEEHAGGKRVEFCENGAKAVADEATRRRVGKRFFAAWSLPQLEKRSARWLNDQGRLTVPVIRRPGADHYAPIGWGEAYGLMAGALRQLDSPNEAVFYTSGRTGNEAAFLYQLLARSFGTNNLPDSSNLCHESSGMAMQEAIGCTKGTVSLQDFDRADAIFIFGQNPGSNHPRMLATLQRAHRRGAKIVSINPLRETGLRRFRNPKEITGYLSPGTPLADLHLPVRINGDVALIKGLCKALLEAENRAPGRILDERFIATSTSDFEAFRADIERTAWATIVDGSGIGETDIRAAARIAADADNTICCWAMGLTQHRNAVANVQSIVNFLMLRGNLGRPGAGACPVRGHSNVQGDRTMGITERPAPRFVAALRREFGIEAPADAGLNAVDAVRAMHDGRVGVFVALGGNFAAALPDTAYTEAALRRCRLTVQIATKLNRSHVVTGDSALILPALARSDRDEQPAGLQFVTCENSMGVVTASCGKLSPLAGDMKSEVRIVAEMASALFRTSSAHAGAIDWEAMANDYAQIRGCIERVVPGFAGFDRRLAAEGRIVLPHAVRDERRFATATGRAAFTVHPLPSHARSRGRYLMMTIRSHDQFNTTVYSARDRYRGVDGTRRVLFMNPDDAAAAGVASGTRVDLTSEFDGRERTVRGFLVVPFAIPVGCVAGYYPETNGLIPIGHVAERSNTPAYKSVVVRVNDRGPFVDNRL
ncbi:MAG: FdhF/YdeP family oxidoreductase, partial [Gammaproteobacteria bacterium]